MSKFELTDEQKAIVKDFGANMFVSAGAGSGKTSIVIEGFIDVLQRGIAEIDQILTITFTDKAAGQMMRKARELLADKGMLEERRRIEEARISTIHSFCSSLIRKHALALGLDPRFKVADEAQSRVLKEEAFRESLERFAADRGEPAVELIFNLDRNRTGELFVVIDTLHDELRSRGIAEPDFDLPDDDMESALARLADSIVDALNALQEAKSNAPTVERSLHQLRKALEEPNEQKRLVAIMSIRPPLTCGPKEAVREVLRRRLECISIGHLHVVELLRDLLREYSSEYAVNKRRAGRLDFEDLQLEALRLLRDNKDIRERVAVGFKLIVVDEFQDTNGLQCEIIDLIARDNVCFVGDEKQSIYRFRHADVELFKRRRNSADGRGNVKPLSTNFRSQEEILTFVDHLFSPEDMLGGEGYLSMRAGVEPEAGSGAPRIEVCLVDGESNVKGKANVDTTRLAEAELVARRLSELFKPGGGYGPGDAVILLRKKRHAELFREALDRYRIQNYLSIGRDYYKKMELGDAMNLLRVLVNPLDDAALLGVLRSPLVGLSDDTLVMLRRYAGRGDDGKTPPPLWATVSYEGTLAKLPEDQGERLRQYIDDYESIRYRSRRQPLERTVRQVIDYHDYAAVAAAGEDGRKAFANLLKLVDLAADFEEAWGRNLAAFVEFLVEQKDQEAQEGDAPTEEEGSGSVQIMTIHTAKGLEFPLVVWAWMGSEMRHRNNKLIVGPDGGIGIDLNNMLDKKDRYLFAYERYDDVERERGLEEEKRIAYVAMTRAMRRLILCGVTNIGNESKGAASRQPIEWVKGSLGLDRDNPDFEAMIDREPFARMEIKVDAIDGCPVLLTVCTDPEALVADAARIDASLDDFEIEPLDAELLRLEQPRPRYVPATISASAFPVYQKCPRRYYLERDLRLEPVDDSRGGTPAGDRLPGHVMGSLVHRALELAPMAPGIQIDTSREHLNLVMARDLNEPLELSAEDLARATRLLEAMATMPVAGELSRSASADRLYREHTFSTLVGESIVSGSIDALCRRDDGALVVDYKTDTLDDRADLDAAARHHSLQMEGYAVAASRLGWGHEVEVVLVFLDREEAQVARKFSAKDIAAVEQGLIELIASMGDGLFPPLTAVDPGFCPGCAGFRGRHKICATAARAAPAGGDVG